MAAAEQEERPAEAAVSSIVSTPLGKMAKTTSPTKKPAHHMRQPATPSGERTPQPIVLAAENLVLHSAAVRSAWSTVNMRCTPPHPAVAGVTPAALRRLSALGVAATPPVASATRHPAGGAGSAPGSLLLAPEGESSRVLASPELLPVPYTQRLQLPGAPPAVAGEGPEASEEGGTATVVVSASGAVTFAGDPAVGDGMENLTQQVMGKKGRH